MSEPRHGDATSGPDLQAHADRSLEALRRRLLDLKASNSLLNLRPRGRGYLRVIDEVPEALFAELRDGAAFSFRPVAVPAARAAPAKGKPGEGPPPEPDVVAAARAEGLDPSFDLPEPPETAPKKHADGFLQTLHFPADLEAHLEQIRRRSTTLLQELGVPTLFLAFGSLEWFEADSSDKALDAPLVLLPVGLRRELRGGRYVYKLRCAEEGEAQTNATLRVKLRRDFGLELPELGDAGELGAYLKSVAGLVGDRPRWRVRRRVTLGIFRFERAVMYADLGATDWAPTAHPVLRRLLGAAPGEAPAPADDARDLDAPAFDAGAPALVTEADSSQTMAVLDALAGKNLVVRGPPGTGKSQTITNLIAAALAEGKSVLFVAEKMAALEVVRKRLEEANLGEFALELHSTKASKRAVLDHVQRRLALGKVPGAVEAHENRLAASRRARDAVNEYLRAVHAPFGELGATLFEILWRHERLRPAAALPWFDRLAAVRVEGARALGREQLLLEQEAIRSYVTRRADARAVSAADDAHPWCALVERGDLGVVDEQPLLAATRAWAAALADLSSRARSLLPDGAPATAERLAAAARGAASLPALGPDDLGVADAIAPPGVRPAATAVLEAVRALNELETTCAAVGLAYPGGRLEGDALAEALHVASALGLGPAALGQFAATLSQRVRTATELEGAAARLRRLATSLGWGAARLGPDVVGALVRLGDLVRATDRRTLLARSEGAVAEKPPGLLPELTSRVARLRARAAALDASAPGWRGANAAALREAAVVLRTSGWWARAAGAEYKAAWRAAVALLRDATLPREEAAARLEHCAAALDEARAVAGDERLRRLVGPHEDWSTVDLERLQAVDRWAADVRRATAGVDDAARAVRDAALRAPLDALDAVAAETAGPRRDVLASCSRRPGAGDLEALVAADRALAERGLASASRLREAGIRPDATLDELRALRALVEAAARHETALQRSGHVVAALGARWHDVRRDPAPLGRALGWLENVAAGARALGLREGAGDAPPSHRFAALRSEAAAALAAVEHERRAREAAASAGVTAERVASRAGGDVAAMGETVARALGAPDALRGWLLYCRARDEALRLPRVRAVLEALANAEHDLTGLDAQYEWLVYRELAHEATRHYPLLAGEGWSGERLARERERFVELDGEVLRSQQAVVRDRLLAKAPPPGVGTGPKSAWTELALLRHEAGKQKRHLPIRELVARAPGALRGLSPCFMMSPLSVAQYLPRAAGQFDLLVIDEASQMRPEDALGAVVRAKQAVVVGDERQLPPTSFFDRVASGDEADEEKDGAEDRVESILDWGLGSFGHARELLWHYRSRHESLIAFSNDRFYGGRLLVFPSARRSSEETGVRLRPVDGHYEASRNAAEAKAVVDATVRFMRDHPARSLGVVAMNQKQAELIEASLDEEVRARGDDSYRARWADTLSPFFVKNLESVQGDERDVMFVSMTYGPPSPGGPVPQRFGPVNGADGHRRLNVLFTRAREQLVVFSSMKPADVRVEAASSRGVGVLRDFLEYAGRGGRLATAEKKRGRDDGDSPFEQLVAELLTSEGFEVEPRVGVQGFFIDLGVTHRAYPHGYVCGVECDGAAYHATRSARDRDRIRQRVLEGLGWTIVRIWSTDWFRHPDRARAKLVADVKGVLEAVMAGGSASPRGLGGPLTVTPLKVLSDRAVA
jgi:very-short-patch-repair endonuclease